MGEWVKIAELEGKPGDAAAMALLAKMPQRRGLLPDGANANDYYLPEHYGIHQGVSTGGYLNMPPAPASFVLEVLPASAGLAVVQRRTDSDGMIWREAIDAAAGQWGPWRKVADEADVPMPERQRMIYDLAKSDGWFALYDPANPKGRDLINGDVATIYDLMGNLPPATTTVASSRPRWSPASWDGYGGAWYGVGDVPNALRTGLFPEALQQPTFIMTLARSDISNPTGRVIIDGATNAGRQAILASALYPGKWGSYAGNEFGSTVDVDAADHVFGAQFNGAFSTTGSRFFVDGTPRTGSFGSTANTRPLDGLTLGNHQAGTAGRWWDGLIGPTLIYKGIPSDDVRARMERALQSITLPASLVQSDRLKSKEAVLMRADGTLDFGKLPDQPEIPASLTKMLTQYVARKTVTNARLNEALTLDSTEMSTINTITGGSSPEIKAGDVITWRELFYLASLPSHNVAAELLAARVGAELPGTDAPRDKFIALMNSTVQGWGWTGANFTTASGLGTSNKATARQMAQLIFRIRDEDSTLIGIMGELTHTVTITGPNARTFTINHSIPVNGNPSFPEFIAGKTGTLNNIIGNVCMLVTHGGTVKALVTMGALPVNDRYPDARTILDGNASTTLSRSPGLTEFINMFLQSLNNPNSRLKQALDELYLQ
ncbi:hypothetical protein [Glutamicibacter sp.]|uniref:hypothetical protein n=1 Tax=Glutamicibacter sp. TaxID=1931995 RepID=UPI0028BD2AFD|nr:hypothetical protein [Glutamicibacter sp.]